MKERERKWTETNGHWKWLVHERLPLRQPLSAALTQTDRPTGLWYHSTPPHPSLIPSYFFFFLKKETTTGFPNSLQCVIYGMLMWLQANLCCEQFNFNTVRVLGIKQLRRELKNHLKGPPNLPTTTMWSWCDAEQWCCVHASTIKKRESPKIKNWYVSLSLLCSF